MLWASPGDGFNDGAALIELPMNSLVRHRKWPIKYPICLQELLFQFRVPPTLKNIENRKKILRGRGEIEHGPRLFSFCCYSSAFSPSLFPSSLQGHLSPFVRSPRVAIISSCLCYCNHCPPCYPPHLSDKLHLLFHIFPENKPDLNRKDPNKMQAQRAGKSLDACGWEQTFSNFPIW